MQQERDGKRDEYRKGPERVTPGGRPCGRHRGAREQQYADQGGRGARTVAPAAGDESARGGKRETEHQLPDEHDAPRSRSAAEPALADPRDRLCPVRDGQLGEDRREVVAHGLGGEPESAGDGPVALTGGGAVEDLPLPGCQLGEPHLGDRARAGEVAEDPRGNARPEDRFPRRGGAQCPVDLGLLGALEQVAPRARAHRGEHRVVVLVHRQHQDRSAGHGRRDPPGRLQAVRCPASARPSRRRPGAGAAPRGRRLSVRRLPDDGRGRGGSRPGRAGRCAPRGGRRR